MDEVLFKPTARDNLVACLDQYLGAPSIDPVRLEPPVIEFDSAAEFLQIKSGVSAAFCIQSQYRRIIERYKMG
jgi:hypothetical protein